MNSTCWYNSLSAGAKVLAMSMSFWIALLPFLVLFIWLIPLRRPAIEAAPIAFLVALLTGLLIWQMPGRTVAAAIVDAGVVYLEVMLIMGFALLLLNVLVASGRMSSIEAALSSFTGDTRVSAMLLGWGLVGFVEGIAGFGTPLLIAVPLLIVFRMAPFKAIVVGLVGNSIAVAFGAAGTPVHIGMAGLGLERDTLEGAVLQTAVILAPFSIFVTLFMAWVVTRGETQGRFQEFVPFATFSALAFAIPYSLVAWLVGPELPSIIGGAVAMACIALAARAKFLLPPSAHPTADIGPSTSWRVAAIALVPFAFLSLALLASRAFMPLRELLISVRFSPGQWFGLDSAASLTPLFTPYAYFALALIVALVLFRASASTVKQASADTVKRLRVAAIVLAFMIALTQLLLKSGTNNSGLASMPEVLALGIASALGQAFPVFSSLLGAFGSFMTGSATVSNLLFAPVQLDAGKALSIAIPSVIALQLIGAAVGNMISLQNIAMATAAADVGIREGRVISNTIVPVVVICIVAGLLVWSI